MRRVKVGRRNEWILIYETVLVSRESSSMSKLLKQTCQVSKNGSQLYSSTQPF